MPSRASCTDGSLHCLTIATRGQTPDMPSKMPPWAPLASFSPKRHAFLAYQRRLQCTKERANAHTLLGVAQVPCDNQVRTLLDPIAPSHLDAVFLEVFERLEQPRMLEAFRVMGDQMRVGIYCTY